VSSRVKQPRFVHKPLCEKKGRSAAANTMWNVSPGSAQIPYRKAGVSLVKEGGNIRRSSPG